jgi:hypothetical protein
MNRTATKRLRNRVMAEMGYEPNEVETPHEIAKYPEFKKIFRARKKNELRQRNRQYPVNDPGKPVTSHILKRKKLRA